MTPASTQVLRGTDRDLPWRVCVLIGAAVYGWIIFFLLMPADPQSFGWSLYDEAFLALQAGQLDLPARALRGEGHFTPDGVGYLYHGVAPLLTRFILSPFVDVAHTPLAPFSIWFWAVIGTAFYYRAFLLAAQSAWPERGRYPGVWFFALTVGIWIGGPGLILASNLALFHEIIAISYALAGGVVWLWTRAVIKQTPLRDSLLLMACLAALCVHARPHVAVGLYAVVLFASATALRSDFRAALRPAVLAVVVLGLGGASYLGYNHLRFENASTVHGSFEPGAVQYGKTFWDLEAVDSPRAAAFVEHGRFNVKRIIPNALIYGLQPPFTTMPSAQNWAASLHAAATEDLLGKIRIEDPGAGVLALWTVWAVLAGVGLCAGLAAIRPWAGLLFGTGIVVVMICAYGTITLRYHVDIWPFVSALALIGILKATPVLAKAPIGGHHSIAMITAGLFGLMVNTSTAYIYTTQFQEVPGGIDSVWSYELCEAFARQKQFSADRIQEICRAPRAIYSIPNG